MEVGVEVWAKDRTQGSSQSWVPAIVHSKSLSSNGKHWIVVVRSDSIGDVKYSISHDNSEIEDLKLRNDPSESNVENLINLPYLHEPAILFCLQQRYGKGDIYTYTGPILIAMNPFKRVPLYTPQILEVYYNLGLLKAQGIVTDDGGTPLPPHVYAIADAAYRDMMKVIMHGYGVKDAGESCNHSILISGESGAGKTESTKIVLKYLTTVGNSTVGSQLVDGSVMDRVLQSNPILEAFGNAKTLRNDNSSRFGKFIELNFNKRGHLIGGTIKTYLLEKVRLPSQQQGERNFHIFYQLIAGANVEERDRWHLLDAEDFHYTSKGQVFRLRNVNDQDEYRDLKVALNTLSFSVDNQRDLFDLVAGCLHLGQLQFQAVFSGEGEGSAVASDSGSRAALQAATVLLGLDEAELVKTLTVRTIVARDDTYEKKLTQIQASDARDALAKAIYGRIFDWIVRTINLSIQVDASQVRANIGVLDIFGFECFQQNSFEQLCINYTNETLQQQFNQYIFKMEQVEYQAEKIEWSFIEFPDNQDCLDLIENKVNGILAMVDDECRLPSSSDERLASRMYKALESHSRFMASAPQRRDNKFCVKHYAGPVVYCTITFVDKNKDEVPKEATSLLQRTSVSLLQQLFTEFSAATVVSNRLSIDKSTGPQGGNRRISAAKPCSSSVTALNSVASQFKEQLAGLMEKIYSTVPHYIRCLKPNDENIPDSFDRLRITEQLRYGGVLEAVRVARSGFPVRLSHVDFYSRYRSLANPFSTVTAMLPFSIPAVHVNNNIPSYGPEKHVHHDNHSAPGMTLREMCELLLTSLWDVNSEGTGSIKRSNRLSRIEELATWTGKLNIGRESVQLGLSKVFLRKSAHDILESRRSRRLVAAARRLQSHFRCHRARSRYVRIRIALQLMQRVGRGMIARQRATHIRKSRCVVRLQSAYRMHWNHRRYCYFKKALHLLQSRYRGRRSLRTMRLVALTLKVVTLQRIMRGLIVKKKWKCFRRALITLQNRLRKARAKMELRTLRIAARDLGRLKQSNEALKAEIEALKAKAEADNRRMQLELEQQLQAKAEKAKAAELEVLRVELDKALRQVESERKLRLETEIKLKKAESLKTTAESDLVDNEGRLFKSEEALRAANKKILSLESSLSKSRTSLPLSSTSSGTTPASFPGPAAASGLVGINALQADSSKLQEELKREQQQTKLLHEECRRTAAALEKEAGARRLLEDELIRLRQISVEYKLQLDSMKKNNTANSAVVTNGELMNGSTQPSIVSPNPTAAVPLASFTSKADLPQSAMPRKLSQAEEEKLALAGQSAQRNRSFSEKAAQYESAIQSHQTKSQMKPGTFNSMQQQSRNPTGRNVSISASFSHDEDRSNGVPLSPSVDQTELATAMSTFEKNLDSFRTKLKTGVKGFYWEGNKVSCAEILLKLDPTNRLLVFETSQNRRGFSIFQSRVDIAPVSVSDIVECLPGADIKSESSEQSLLLTVVAKTDGKESRLLALKFTSRDQRNTVLTGMRTLVADLHINSPTAKALKNLVQPSTIKTNNNLNSTSNNGNGTSRTIKPEVEGGMSINPMLPAPAPIYPSLPPNNARLPARKLTKRDAVIEETLSMSQSRNKIHSDILTSAVVSESEEKLKMQLSLERANYDRMMGQMIQLSNELNDRDEQIAVLKKKESHYEQTLLDRDNMFKQDAMVRMQLGKRLEQVLMDKEEALEQLEHMKEQVEHIRSTLNINITSLK